MYIVICVGKKNKKKRSGEGLSQPLRRSESASRAPVSTHCGAQLSLEEEEEEEERDGVHGCYGLKKDESCNDGGPGVRHSGAVPRCDRRLRVSGEMQLVRHQVRE